MSIRTRWSAATAGLLGLLSLVACEGRPLAPVPSASETDAPTKEADPVAQTPPTPAKVTKTDAEWRALLTPEQYHILREKGTERAYSGAYWQTETAGTYVCAGCGTPLFKSDAKFESGCGWPSFFEPLKGARLTESTDHVIGYPRTEICCATCGGHMGHVFDDGPPPTGLRYCINSGSIKLVPAEAAGKTVKPGADVKKGAAGPGEPPPK